MSANAVYCWKDKGQFLSTDKNFSFSGGIHGLSGISFFICLFVVNNQKVKVKSLSRVQLFATPWTTAHQAPLSMGFSRQEYWSGVPFPSPGDLPDPGIEPGSPAFQVDALTSEPPGLMSHDPLENVSVSCVIIAL